MTFGAKPPTFFDRVAGMVLALARIGGSVTVAGSEYRAEYQRDGQYELFQLQVSSGGRETGEWKVEIRNGELVHSEVSGEVESQLLAHRAEFAEALVLRYQTELSLAMRALEAASRAAGILGLPVEPPGQLPVTTAKVRRASERLAMQFDRYLIPPDQPTDEDRQAHFDGRRVVALRLVRDALGVIGPLQLLTRSRVRQVLKEVVNRPLDAGNESGVVAGTTFSAKTGTFAVERVVFADNPDGSVADAYHGPKYMAAGGVDFVPHPGDRFAPDRAEYYGDGSELVYAGDGAVPASSALNPASWDDYVAIAPDLVALVSTLPSVAQSTYPSACRDASPAEDASAYLQYGTLSLRGIDIRIVAPQRLAIG